MTDMTITTTQQPTTMTINSVPIPDTPVSSNAAVLLENKKPVAMEVVISNDNKPTKISSKKKTRKSQDCPIFLRKTYLMVDSCEPSIASWSTDGETFVVKDPEKFAAEIIPQYFKHSNFASFVRQLNFYGFHKIRYSDSLKIDPKIEAETANFWRFHNPNFKRGRTDLLSEIRRGKGGMDGTTDITSEQQAEEVNTLKREMSKLREKVAKMTNTLDELSSAVKNMNIGKIETGNQFVQVDSTKKRKIDVKSIPQGQTISKKEESSTDLLPMEVGSSSMTFLSPSKILPSNEPMTRHSTLSSIDTVGFVEDLIDNYQEDEDDLGSLSLDSISSVKTPLPPLSYEKNANTELNFIPVEDKSCDSANKLSPELQKKLNDTLSILPKQMQEMLVEKMVSSIMKSDILKDANIITSENRLTTNITSENSGGINKPFLHSLPKVSGVPVKVPDVDKENKKLGEAELQSAMRVVIAFMMKNGQLKSNGHLNKMPSFVSVHA